MSKGIQPVLNHHSKRREGGAAALFEHPLNGLPAPASQTEDTHTNTFSLQSILNQVHSFTHPNTLSQHTHTHVLITHAFPLPTVTAKQCPPLPSRCTPPLPSLHFTSPPTSSAPLPFFFVVGAVIEEFLPC